MTRFTRVVYAAIGVLAILLGVTVLVRPALALPPDAATPLTTHLIREEGALAVFVGLMAFWCVAHFQERRPVHFSLLLFAAVFAAIHWAEFAASRRGLASPVVNSLPFLLLGVTAPWRRSAPAGSR